MARQDRIIQILCIALIALSLLGSSVLSTEITAEAGRSQLTYVDAANEDESPEVAVGIAMGAFRGLFVNYLWLRASKLKEEGKFYEAIELSEAITRLQPRFPRVWSFHAWNMAYNISVATNTASERWQWVNAGVALLRDEAIPRNPSDVLLHKELAWIFLHKIQGYTDDANRFYKREMAREWTIVVGRPPQQPLDREWTFEEAKRAYAVQMSFIAEMPNSEAELIEVELESYEELDVPEEERWSRVEKIFDLIRDEAGLEPGKDVLRFVETYAAYRSMFPQGEYDGGLLPAQYNDVIGQIVEDPDMARALTAVLAYIRKRVLIEEYHMDPERMYQYTLKYGPLDWRHPASHAVYWASLGVDQGLTRKSTTRFDTLNTDRVMIHAIQELFRTGDVEYNIITNSYTALYNLHFVDVYGDILNNELRGRGDDPDGKKAFTLYGAGYQNFLADAIRMYFRMGEIETANRYFSRLRNWEGRTFNDPEYIALLGGTLEEFVRVETEEDDQLTRPSVAMQEITIALRDAFTRGLLRPNKERLFKAQWDWAKDVHDYYWEYQKINTNVDSQSQRMEIIPRHWDDVVSAVFRQMLFGGDIDRVSAARIYRKVDIEVQRAIYDDLVLFSRSYIQDEQERVMFGRLFPQPPGMEAYRASRAARRAQDIKSDVEGIEFQQN